MLERGNIDISLQECICEVQAAWLSSLQVLEAMNRELLAGYRQLAGKRAGRGKCGPNL